MSKTEKALRMLEAWLEVEVKTKKYSEPLQEEQYVDFVARFKKVVQHQIAESSQNART